MRSFHIVFANSYASKACVCGTRIRSYHVDRCDTRCIDYMVSKGFAIFICECETERHLFDSIPSRRWINELEQRMCQLDERCARNTDQKYRILGHAQLTDTLVFGKIFSRNASQGVRNYSRITLPISFMCRRQAILIFFFKCRNQSLNAPVAVHSFSSICIKIDCHLCVERKHFT